MTEPEAAAARGRWGEIAATGYLQSCGHRILQNNYKRRTGEVDIISMDGDVIVCTEVKTWFGAGSDDLSRAVSPAKQRRICKTAAVFLLENPRYAGCGVRFDIILIGKDTGISHFSDAFQGAG
ncbi:YraN family protein [Spirochaeta africana]|uniref:UPF0102 protein Spiaf_1220 n=1 Tax=Spirochaeta africana (strain ATCC 700263 / DSM 8902 / Z-7692) TaxID=889378 RepID=H9UIF5_SPIAZ|nr:YraN family protein [Spirochaeta africana]AFG37298.1 putative endonuclease related to Holliday junction resolvase [Spirochaeta africana DSM 8902]